MEKYNPDATCPKCGGNDISDHYQKHSHFPCPSPFWEADIEHIDRHCRNCHYEWAELPLDAKEEAKDDNSNL